MGKLQTKVRIDARRLETRVQTMLPEYLLRVASRSHQACQILAFKVLPPTLPGQQA
jgi:hypothetical protein